ncbi:hypothetical protein PGN35_000685 [Nodosilinea sp. PGN35]
MRTGKVGVTIELAGKRLCLRATLPPRPGSSKVGPYQQRLFLGHHANPAGLKLAEVEAKRVGLLLEAREFDWADYGATGGSCTVADWITAFERDYFTRRQRSAKTETTWRDDYMKAFSKLPQGELLTVELLRATIEATKPDSRTRKRVCD